MRQWVAGFSCIIREESHPNIRNHMLEYMTDLMEDSHDFGWSAAKASHAVLLCRMEDAKVTWGETNKIGHIRRAHAQRIAPHSFGSSNSKKNNSRDRPTPCKFYQKGSCSHKADHESNGHFYLHVCTQGKTMPTQVRIAGVLHQKMNEALQQSSASSQK